MEKRENNIITLSKPPITVYPSIANVLSIVWDSEDKNICAWFCDHFIQLLVRPFHEDTFGDFYDHADLDNFFRILYGMPGLDWMRINSRCFSSETFTDYIESVIDRGYCIEACLDRYYFSFDECYKKTHFIHSSLIYGYDREKDEIYIKDFWADGNYQTKIAKYHEVNDSMNNDWIINLFMKQKTEYKFDKKLMMKYFEDFYYSRDSFAKFEHSNKQYNKGALFGLDYYDYIGNNIYKREKPDVRMFHILYEHKRLMKYRLKYLMQSNEYNHEMIRILLENNDRLIDESLLLRNIVIKYGINKNEALYDGIQKQIEKLKDMDKEFVRDVLLI